MSLPAPTVADPDLTLYPGDCLEVMPAMPAESVDAVVTDPPYGLAFMGRAWDRIPPGPGFAAWTEGWAREALRVLKPGGHLVAFGGTRTFHRLFCGLEDAGLEVRETLVWLHGEGFPKNRNVAADLAALADSAPWEAISGVSAGGSILQDPPDWAGWGSALKPGYEPIALARRPLALPTLAAQVLATGTGAINVDACRIPHGLPGGTWDRAGRIGRRAGGFVDTGAGSGEPVKNGRRHADGRWPTNVALDVAAAAMLDAAAGEVGYGDTGGPSRFFYVAKASTGERDGSRHPTVKPVDLMRWLCRLVCPPGGLILDPFAGSGSTLVAARAEGMRAIGIERERDALADAGHRTRQLSLFGAPDGAG